MTTNLTRSFPLLVAVVLLAVSVTLAPAAHAEKAAKKGGVTQSHANPKAPKATARAKANPGKVRLARAVGPKPKATSKPAEGRATDKDALERKNSGKVDGHKWRPRDRA